MRKGLKLKRIHSTGIIDINVAVMLFGIAGLFGKVLSLPAWCIVLGRTGFAAMALGLVMALSKNRATQPHRVGIPIMGILGAILAIHWVTFFHAIQISTVAVGLLAFSTFPLFITWLEPWWFGEKRRPFDVFTSVAVLLGIAVMVVPSPFGGRVHEGVFWGTISGFTFALLSLLNRKWVQHEAPVRIAFYQNAVACLLLLPMTLWESVSVDGRQMGWLVFLGVICTALSHALFIRGLSTVRAQLASIIACLEPVYGIVLAGLLLHEIPSPYTLAGGTLILLTTAVAMVRRAPT